MYFFSFCVLIFLQIVGESLPISSSAHVQLFSQLTGTPLPTWYYYMLHGPTIAILFIFFRASWFFSVVRFLKHSFMYVLNPSSCSSLSSKRYVRRYCILLVRLLALGICAELPFVVLYAFNSYFIDNYFSVLPVGFICTALLLYSLRVFSCTPPHANYLLKNRPSYRDAFFIGCAQACALLPGVSRLGSTYVAARWCGIRPAKAFRFSCIVQLPLISIGFAKGVYEYSTLYSSSNNFITSINSTSICILLATGISYAALYSTWLLAEREKLWYYAYYLLVPLAISLSYVFSCYRH